MKKLLVLMAALALLAFALPALAQDVIDNDINRNGTAVGNAQGRNLIQTNQFRDAVGGDSSNAAVNGDVTNTDNFNGNTTDITTGFLNGSTVTAKDNLSGNKVDSSVGFINKSEITVKDSFSGNISGNTVVGVTATLDNSLNGNTLYNGGMGSAWKNQHQFEHQNDHQMNFPNTFYSSEGATIFMPISNTNMEQANTGIVTGNYAGSVDKGANGCDFSKSVVAGMVAINSNLGGVGVNQTLLNSVTAFSASTVSP